MVSKVTGTFVNYVQQNLTVGKSINKTQQIHNVATEKSLQRCCNVTTLRDVVMAFCVYWEVYKMLTCEYSKALNTNCIFLTDVPTRM